MTNLLKFFSNNKMASLLDDSFVYNIIGIRRREANKTCKEVIYKKIENRGHKLESSGTPVCKRYKFFVRNITLALT